MNKRKEFSILKWVVFPANSVVLAGVVAYFNLRVFGLEDGVPYSIIVAMIGLFSIVIVKYAESDNRTLARAAFVFEVILICALIVNAAYSISVQRKMSVARMAETNQKETITEIGKLRGSRTQREALQKIDKQQSAQSIFANVEQVLFWIAVGELLLYALSTFTLFAIAKLVEDDRSEAAPPDEFPAALDVEKRSITRRSELTPKKTTRGDIPDDTHSQQKTTRDDTAEGLKRLRGCLGLISFEHPPGHYKVDPKPDNAPPKYLVIRHMVSNRGDETTTHSVRSKLSILDDAIRMTPATFRSRLEKFLRENDFEL